MPKRPVEARVLAAVAADDPAGELGGSYPLGGGFLSDTYPDVS